MSSDEKFSIGKLLDFSPVGFYKVIGLSIKVALILLLVLGVLWVKNLLFPKQSIVKDITVQSGGKVIINDNKRKLEYFGGLYGDVTGDDKRVGAFGGIKF